MLARVSLLLTFTTLLSLSAFSASIGLSPGSVNFDGVLRGGYAEHSVVLSTSSTEPLGCQITEVGPAKTWFRYEADGNEGRQFTLQPRSHLRLKIIAEPPSDVPNGVYEGIITVATIPHSGVGGGTGSVISTGVSLRYSIVISDLEKAQYSVPEVTVKDTEERMPIEFESAILNDGNVRVYPKIKIDILGEDGQTLYKTAEFTDRISLPTTRQNQLFIVQNDLEVGKYIGRFTAFLNNEKVREELLPFEVLEKGSLRIQGKLVKVELNKIWVYEEEIVEIKATFQNNGVLSTPAVFKGKATVDDTVVQIFESDEIELGPGEVGDLVMYYTPKSPGRHIISGTVHFSKKVTEEKSSILNVLNKEDAPKVSNDSPDTGKQSSDNGGLDINSILMVVIALLITAVLLGILLNRRGKTEPKPKVSHGKRSRL